MPHKDLRRSFWEQPRAVPQFTEVMQDFLEAATNLRFETRYIGEEAWWPVSTEEVAQTLGRHHEDLVRGLHKMLGGVPLRSPVAEFRVIQDALQTLGKFALA